MTILKERLRLLKAAFAKLPYLDDYMHQVTYYHQQKQLMENSVLFSNEKGVSNNTYNSKQLIVSLTTHGKRINVVFQAIESIFRQTYKPNKVILYLSEQEFHETTIPISLHKQIERGLEVHYVKDIGSYTKLIPALYEFPDDLIVTIDDDYMYPFDMLEKLINAHFQHPQSVCCSFSRIMKLSADGFAPYSSFEMNFSDKDSESLLYLAEGFGGILYPPHSLHPDVFREDLFMKLSPMADDLWFKAMSLLQNIPVCQIANDRSWFRRMASEESVQDSCLKHVNVNLQKNDEQLRALCSYYSLNEKLHL